MVDLVARPHPAVPDPAARVLDHPAAVAYCLPGVLHPRVVLSAGVLTLLNGRELACVLAHERVHLHARHDLVVLPFAALAAALRWLPWPQQARDAVAALVEMLADDQACRGHDRRILAAALVRVGTAGRLPAGALPAGEHAVVARLRPPRCVASPCSAWQAPRCCPSPARPQPSRPSPPTAPRSTAPPSSSGSRQPSPSRRAAPSPSGSSAQRRTRSGRPRRAPTRTSAPCTLPRAWSAPSPSAAPAAVPPRAPRPPPPRPVRPRWSPPRGR